MKGDLREAAVALSMITGWALSEVLDLDEDDFAEYYETAIRLRDKV